jgi:DNA polymerase III epsilon subunit-like protein
LTETPTQPRLVFIDTETTGLSDRAEVWEIGAIERSPGAADVEYAWQIRPTLIDAEPTGLRIGRYYKRSKLVRHQPGDAFQLVHPDYDYDTPGESYQADAIERMTIARSVASEPAMMIDGAYLVGAVPWFDERKLQKFMAMYGQCATNHYHLIDVETLAAGALKMPPPWDFDKVLAAYNLTYDEADRHTALGDARMARDLYDAILGGKP